MKKNYLLGVLGVLLIVGIGISFAYFVSGVLFSGEGSSVTLEPGDMIKVTYDAGSGSLNTEGMIPGDSTSKDFTVTVTPTETEKEATYGIFLDITENTFVKCDDTNYNDLTNACTRDAQELTYTITDKDSGETLKTGDLTGVNGKIKLLTETKTVDIQTIFNYTITITFVDTGADQNHNQNKTFNGRVGVEFSGKLLKDEILANNVLQTGAPDFSKTAQADCTEIENCEETNGLYQAEDDNGTTYYFRGVVNNNWVSFAGYYWRIIRINGDGSIRMIYSGDSESGPIETGEGTQIGTSAFNDQYDDNAYVGYMYGIPKSDTYEETHANINDSTIKTVLETWYQQNLLSYSNYISTEIGFCGDKTPSTSASISNEQGGTGRIITYYGAFIRLYTNKAPTFKCTSDSDLYTTSGSSQGNKSPTYPIGLISADEVAYAGGVYNINKGGYYLYTGENYWTMTPYWNDSRNANVFNVCEGGSVGYIDDVNWTEPGVRPVINLRTDVTVIGSGTATDPYVVV